MLSNKSVTTSQDKWNEVKAKGEVLGTIRMNGLLETKA